MTLIEVLVLILLGNALFNFIISIFLIFKMHILERAFTSIQDPKKIIEEILKTKVPILMGPDGPVPYNEIENINGQNKKTDVNPLTN